MNDLEKTITAEISNENQNAASADRLSSSSSSSDSTVSGSTFAAAATAAATHDPSEYIDIQGQPWTLNFVVAPLHRFLFKSLFSDA